MSPAALVALQVARFRAHCVPNVPQWYETKRRTTHVIFWSDVERGRVLILHKGMVDQLRERGVEPPPHVLAEKIPTRECRYFHGQPCPDDCGGRGLCLEAS